MLYAGFCIIGLVALAIILAPLLRAESLTKKQRGIVAAVVAVGFFVSLFAVYAAVGAPEVVALSAEREVTMAQVRHDINLYSVRVRDNPADAEAWLALGANFLQTGQTAAAVNAYRQAVKLTKGDPKVILVYVQAQVTDANGNVSDEAAKGLEMVLMQDPKNPEARYLTAVRKLQQGKNAEAMKMMRELYHSLPEGAPLKDLIDRQIGNK